MRRTLDPKRVKSAQRVLEVLEFFNEERQEGTVMDFVREFGYPQSSTSELLSCLVALGYLRRDPYARTYKPAARVAVLGAWVQPRLFREGAMLPLMDELASESRATVTLESKVGLQAQVIHAVLPATGERIAVRPGDTCLLLHSAPGKALLTTLQPDLVRRIVHRLNAEVEPDLRVRCDDLLSEVNETMARGYATSETQERGMISVLLPQSGSDEPLALTICSSRSAMERDREDYLRLLRAAISRRLGLVEVCNAPAAVREPLRQAI